MKIELNQQKEKQFFERQEYLLHIKDETTPSYDILKTEISKKLNSNADLTVIKKVRHQFGSKEIIVSVYVYSTAEALKKYEGVKEEKKAEAEKPAA